jgi:integrase
MASKKRRRGHGEGSIYQRKDGRWEAYLDLGYLGGKRTRKYVYGKTRKEVQEKLRDLQRQQEQGVNLAGERMTVAQYLTIWLEQTVQGTCKAKTYESYGYISRVYLMPALGHIQLDKLTVHQVQQMANALGMQDLSPRTVQYAVGVLSRALNKAVKFGYLSRNVAALVDTPRVERRIIEPLTVEQAYTLLGTLEGHRLKPLYHRLRCIWGCGRASCWRLPGRM